MCAHTLAEILERNPFIGVQDEWRRILSQSVDMNLGQLSGRRFVLPEDGRNESFNAEVEERENAGVESRLRLEFLPMPFVGNPDAQTWYIQINPGVSDLDFYDMFSVSPELKGSVRDLLASEERIALQAKLNNAIRKGEGLAEQTAYQERVQNCHADDFSLDESESELVRLQARQSLLIEQLDLRNASSVFYPLKRCFRTLRESPNARRLSGSYRWWKSALCLDNADALFSEVFSRHAEADELARIDAIADELGGRLFVMEYFPYHSSSFEKIESYGDGHQYLAFLSDMLQYAQENHKRIIFRSRNDARAVLGGVTNNVFVLRNPSRVFLTNHGLVRA